MGEPNGSLRDRLIRSRSDLPALAAEMAGTGMISPETLTRLLKTYRGKLDGYAQEKVRVI